VTFGRRRDFRPFATRGRRTAAGILFLFALFSGLSLFLSIRTTKRAQHRAPILQIAGRQRTLAERYANSVLLVRDGTQSNPGRIAFVLERSGNALLNGGTAPALDGDDDDARLPRAGGTIVRRQLVQEQQLIRDLAATGAALIEKRAPPLHLTGHERLSPTLSPSGRLMVLTALTSNVSLNVSRSLGEAGDDRLAGLISQQVLLGVLGLLVFALLSWALIASTRRQSAHFRSLVTSTTDLILAFSDTRCRYASRSVLQMVGRPESDVLEAGFAEFVHPDDLAPLLQALEAGTPPKVAFRLQQADGQWRDLEANVTDLRDDRDVRGIVINARDVTERNRAEAERESVLAQEVLANKRLRELDALKDEFVALVSHELRTPLTSISGYLELMLEGSLEDDQRQFAEIIDRNADRLLLLINDLLFIAQVEAGKLTLEHEDVELDVLVDQAVSIAMPIAVAAEVELLAPPARHLSISGDAVRLGQLLDNLVSNAIKFTPAGGRVDVTSGEAHGRVWIEVRDTGIGISKIDQQWLFDKFFRTEAATQGAIQGTGLGLAISKAIVHAHAGSIQVESDAGAGSVFRIEFPLRLRPSASTAAPQLVSAATRQMWTEWS
jgi:PAS domain S-box-containing protein